MSLEHLASWQIDVEGWAQLKCVIDHAADNRYTSSRLRKVFVGIRYIRELMERGDGCFRGLSLKSD